MPKMGGKKNKPNMIFLYKNKGPRKFLSEWLINYSWEKIKNIRFFFSNFSEKKKHFSKIWVSEWPLNLSREKKKNATFARGYLFEFENVLPTEGFCSQNKMGVELFLLIVWDPI